MAHIDLAKIFNVDTSSASSTDYEDLGSSDSLSASSVTAKALTRAASPSAKLIYLRTRSQISQEDRTRARNEARKVVNAPKMPVLFHLGALMRTDSSSDESTASDDTEFDFEANFLPPRSSRSSSLSKEKEKEPGKAAEPHHTSSANIEFTTSPYSEHGLRSDIFEVDADCGPNAFSLSLSHSDHQLKRQPIAMPLPCGFHPRTIKQIFESIDEMLLGSRPVHSSDLDQDLPFPVATELPEDSPQMNAFETTESEHVKANMWPRGRYSDKLETITE